MTNSSRNASISSDLPQPGAAPALSTLRTSGALFLWLVLQLAALAIAAFHIPLWAHTPNAEDLLALQYLLVAQLAGSGLLFPLLTNSSRRTVFTTASSWPMIVLAGMLSSTRLSVICLAEMFITAWLLGLGVINWAIAKQSSKRRASNHPPLPSTGLEMIAVAVISSWTIGGPLMLFCRAEYDPGVSTIGPWSKVEFGPISSAFSAVFDSTAASWAPLAALWLAVVLLAAVHALSTHNSARITSPAVT